jgi:hypothetical protein
MSLKKMQTIMADIFNVGFKDAKSGKPKDSKVLKNLNSGGKHIYNEGYNSFKEIENVK